MKALPVNVLKQYWLKTPSIFLHRWATRFLLQIVSVRVQQLQDITIKDIWAEGIQIPHDKKDGQPMLCIAGDGVARGYLNSPDLSRERSTAG